MIAEAIGVLRTGRAERIAVDRPAQPGDVIEAVLEPIDVRGKRLPSGKREEVRMDAGSSTLLPEFREASLGISKGESRMVEVTYPADVRDRELAGKTRRFRMTAREIQEKKLPELDDNFRQERRFEPRLRGAQGQTAVTVRIGGADAQPSASRGAPDRSAAGREPLHGPRRDGGGANSSVRSSGPARTRPRWMRRPSVAACVR